ncbi:hypothetical protein SLEP1_g15044 [Rubroshorea leprosula]|uniref:Uncharacterized protein n=1 Tax=Rubroshorea leprosula TaxID=152421 RepID=A0AAV5IWK4_9ROSI|nr:hypothetical protein SLEP1_g15044 [Rubroshorea leprosula]
MNWIVKHELDKFRALCIRGTCSQVHGVCRVPGFGFWCMTCGIIIRDSMNLTSIEHSAFSHEILGHLRFSTLTSFHQSKILVLCHSVSSLRNHSWTDVFWAINILFENLRAQLECK